MRLKYKFENKDIKQKENNMKNVLEKTGLIDVAFYITAIGYVILLWFLCNVVYRNHRKKIKNVV